MHVENKKQQNASTMETTNHKTIILIVRAKTPAIERTAVSSRTRGSEKTIKNIFCFLRILEIAQQDSHKNTCDMTLLNP